VLHVPYRAAFDRAGGLVSGPVFMAAADAAFWLAILTRGGVADPAVTTDLGTSFLAGARRQGFRCRATVVRWGRRRIWGIAECTAADGRLLTHHTIGYLRPDGPEPPRAIGPRPARAAAPRAGRSRRAPSGRVRG
jgi:acyl-coenzyme A thioesterase PaaI-like protein